jgi:hypothetical protein
MKTYTYCSLCGFVLDGSAEHTTEQVGGFVVKARCTITSHGGVTETVLTLSETARRGLEIALAIPPAKAQLPE